MELKIETVNEKIQILQYYSQNMKNTWWIRNLVIRDWYF